MIPLQKRVSKRFQALGAAHAELLELPWQLLQLLRQADTDVEDDKDDSQQQRHGDEHREKDDLQVQRALP